MPFSHSPAFTSRRPRILVAALAAFIAVGALQSADARPKRGPNADRTPPETTITSGPSGTISGSTAAFGFTSSESGSSFQCRLDSASFTACSSPKSYSGLAAGAHEFAVRAIDRSGNVDATPATRSFTVESDSTTPSSDTAATPSSDGAVPSTWRRYASFESGLNSDVDFGWRIDSPFSVTRTSEVGGIDGSYAAKIVTNGGNSSCSCPRMTYQDGFSFGAGDEVWIGGSWYLTDTRKVAWSRLMNLGHWVSGDPSNWHIQFESTDAGTFQVGYAPYQGTKVKLLSVDPPQGRWFSLDLHLKLSKTDGQALTEVYLDGQLVGSTTKANMWSGGGPLHFFNAGLSYFWPGNGNTTVYLDAPRISG